MPFAELGERRVYYEEHGEGDPVLLVNGLAADHTTWGLQTDAFKERFRVIVFDSGRVVNKGDGGYINWAFQGWFDRPSDSEVVFRRP